VKKPGQRGKTAKGDKGVKIGVGEATTAAGAVQAEEQRTVEGTLGETVAGVVPAATAGLVTAVKTVELGVDGGQGPLYMLEHVCVLPETVFTSHSITQHHIIP
jgi:hypothetical protein